MIIDGIPMSLLDMRSNMKAFRITNMMNTLTKEFANRVFTIMHVKHHLNLKMENISFTWVLQLAYLLIV